MRLPLFLTRVIRFLAPSRLTAWVTSRKQGRLSPKFPRGYIHIQTLLTSYPEHCQPEKLSPETLNLVRAIALLDTTQIHTYSFESLRAIFAAGDPILMLNSPSTPAAHIQACAELYKSGLIEMSDQEKAFSGIYYVWASVLAEM